jgi:hypothetical protein
VVTYAIAEPCTLVSVEAGDSALFDETYPELAQSWVLAETTRVKTSLTGLVFVVQRKILEFLLFFPFGLGNHS